MTGRSRGFGFVTFAESAALERSLEESNHEVDGRTINIAPAEEGRETTNRRSTDDGFRNNFNRGNNSGGYRSYNSFNNKNEDNSF